MRRARSDGVFAELCALARLAAPIVVAQVGLMAMGLVDTVLVGHLSKQALAAVALGNVYAWALLVFGQGVLMALDPLVAQAHGAGDREAVTLAFARGLVVAVVLSVLCIVAFQYAAPVLLLLRQPTDVVPIADRFVRALGPGVPGFFGFVVLRQTLQGMQITRPLWISVGLANAVNLALAYGLVFGRFGLPALGAVGAGVSTALARTLLCLVLAAAAWPALRPIWRAPTRALLALGPYGALLGIGLPIGLQIGLEVWVFMTVSLVMG